jgi:iron complex transport system substrate-binding protein
VAESIHGLRFGAAGKRLLFFSGRMKKAAQNGQRIVSLAPSATSILCALGAKKTLVGVTKWCRDVAPVGDLPKLGDCWHMGSLHEILRLKPTLVIGSVPYQLETVGKLLEQPLNFLATNPRSLADVYADVRLLGGIVGRGKAGEALVRKMQREFGAMERKSKKEERRLRMYCEAWPNPRISSPHWVADLVKLCGGEMVVPAGERVSEKQVAEAKPDLIVLAWAAAGDRANPKRAYEVRAWQEVPAIQNRRVHVISDELLNTPGPPLMKGARELWKLLHRDLKEKEFNAEVTENRADTGKN